MFIHHSRLAAPRPAPPPPASVPVASRWPSSRRSPHGRRCGPGAACSRRPRPRGGALPATTDCPLLRSISPSAPAPAPPSRAPNPTVSTPGLSCHHMIPVTALPPARRPSRWRSSARAYRPGPPARAPRRAAAPPLRPALPGSRLDCRPPRAPSLGACARCRGPGGGARAAAALGRRGACVAARAGPCARAPRAPRRPAGRCLLHAPRAPPAWPRRPPTSPQARRSSSGRPPPQLLDSFNSSIIVAKLGLHQNRAGF